MRFFQGADRTIDVGPMWYVGKKDKAKFGSLRVRVVKKGELPSEVWNKKLNRHLDIMPNPRTIVKVLKKDIYALELLSKVYLLKVTRFSSSI